LAAGLYARNSCAGKKRGKGFAAPFSLMLRPNLYTTGEDYIWFTQTKRSTAHEFVVVVKGRNSQGFFRNAFSLLKQTGQEFLEDKAPQLGAALAYYTV
jgi:hypothetical protein